MVPNKNNSWDIYLTALLIFTPIKLWAEESKCPTYDSFDERNNYLSSSFQWENDIGNSDRWYTNGMKYSRTLNPECNDGYPWLDNFVENHAPHLSETNIFLTSWLMGMNMYTPVKIGIATPQPNDRPWSGWAYFGRNWQLNDIAETKINDGRGNSSYAVRDKQKLEILLGALGDKAHQDRVQRAWHSLVQAQYPAGWEVIPPFLAAVRSRVG